MGEPKMISVLLADDHQLFRSGVISLLSDINDILIVGEVDNGRDFVTKYRELKPDVSLLDITMPFLSGIDALKEILKIDPTAKAIFLSMHQGEEYVYYALRLGSKGLLNKNIMKGELIFAIRSVYSGHKYFGRGYTKSKLAKLEKKFNKIDKYNIENSFSLSPQERKVLLCISKGMTSEEISNELNIGKRTVDSHRHHIMHKLCLKSLPELITYSIRFSLLYKNSL